MGTTFPQWAGFERVPKGRLLQQVVDLDGPLGIAYERSVGFAKGEHIHERHMIVCPRGAAIMDIIDGGERRTRHRVDGRSILWVPRRRPHADESVTTLYDTFALYPSPSLCAKVLADAGVATARRFETSYLSAKRTPFFDELLDQYFATRLVERTEAHAFQERQLVGAAFRLLAGKKADTTPAPATTTDVGERTLLFIEANLFLPIALDAIARHVGASTSTLLRSFRRATGQTPYAYVKRRRLDEAKHLLAGGKHSVGEVALLVGYEDFGAFSKAFRRQFREPPSAIRPRSNRAF